MCCPCCPWKTKITNCICYSNRTIRNVCTRYIRRSKYIWISNRMTTDIWSVIISIRSLISIIRAICIWCTYIKCRIIGRIWYSNGCIVIDSVNRYVAVREIHFIYLIQSPFRFLERCWSRDKGNAGGKSIITGIFAYFAAFLTMFSAGSCALINSVCTPCWRTAVSLRRCRSASRCDSTSTLIILYQFWCARIGGWSWWSLCRIGSKNKDNNNKYDDQ